MKKRLMILVTFVCILSIATSPVLAKSDKSSGTQGKANTQTETQVKGNQESAPKIQSRLTRMTSEQKQEVRNRFIERKQAMIARFSDTKEHWAAKHIEGAQQLGFIKGYEDGTFKPDAPVTITESMIMAVRLSDAITGEDGSTTTDTTTTDTTTTVEQTGEEAADTQEPDQTEDVEEPAGTQEEVDEDTAEETDEEATEGDEDLSEVPGWARDSAKKAGKLGILNVNRLHSEVQATRVQSAVMLAKALGLAPVTSTDPVFTDVTLISAEDLGYIAALKEAGILTGNPDGTFNPNSSVTRAQIAAMLSRIADYVENPDGTVGTGTDGAQEPVVEEEQPATEEPVDSTNP